MTEVFSDVYYEDPSLDLVEVGDVEILCLKEDLHRQYDWDDLRGGDLHRTPDL